MQKIRGCASSERRKEKASVLSFVLEGNKTEEVGPRSTGKASPCVPGTIAPSPTLRRFGLETTVRPSLALYNNYEEIDAMIAALRRLKQLPRS